MSLISIRRPSSLFGDTSITPLETDGDKWSDNCSTYSESYFTVKGTAVILSHSQHCLTPRDFKEEFLFEIETHLQQMLQLLRPEDRLIMAVRLQSNVPDHSRYLAIVSTSSDVKTRESVLIGFDFVDDSHASIGLVIPVMGSTHVELDGDGGILVQYSSVFHLFKPVSIQAMWFVFQSLHKELNATTVPINGAPRFHDWISFYRNSAIATTDDSLCSQWHVSLEDEAAQGDLKAYFDHNSTSKNGQDLQRQKAETEISSKLKQVMQSVDLDEVTSGDIRRRLEQERKWDLSSYKEFIDREMLVILGQMEKPSKIFDYLYLGTEWNASNWDDLEKNRVRYILNVTREVDNFFPSQFEYLKIFVSDEANTELLMHWQKTYEFIKTAKDENSVVLVHCKKGISRSSSTVIAYIMKEYNWPLEKAVRYVKEKRNCITPNAGFMNQLQTFAGMLNASSNRKSAVFNGSITVKSNTTPIMEIH